MPRKPAIDAQESSTFFSALEQHASLSDEQRAEIRSGVINEKLHKWPREEKDRLVKDRECRVKLLDGNRGASQQWQLVLAMLGLRPVKP